MKWFGEPPLESDAELWYWVWQTLRMRDPDLLVRSHEDPMVGLAWAKYAQLRDLPP
ncbi:MAG TPA: hypothetical protein VGB85_28700 [Nannocystis sp.]